MDLTALATEYMESRASTGLVLDETESLQCLLEAVRYYAGYGTIASVSARTAADELAPVTDLAKIEATTVLSVGEWGIVRPLFVLYVERENATRLEASRMMGVDVYGRSVAEIAGDIKMMEDETIPQRCGTHFLIEV